MAPHPHGALPALAPESLTIVPSTLDEWYGIEVRFAWQAFPLEQTELAMFRAALDQDFSLKEALFEAIRTSAAWQTFYAQPRSVSCHRNGFDPARRTVVVPAFPRLRGYYHLVTVTAQGGELLLHTR